MGGLPLWLIATVLSGLVVQRELNKAFDNAMLETAQRLLPLAVLDIFNRDDGAMSMAAGEYVSVSSQADTEQADLARERQELAEQPQEELNELTKIFIARGVSEAVALEVAKQMTEHDALGTHAREELGITDFGTVKPVLAAFTSAMTFTAGALPPLLIVLFSPFHLIGVYVYIATIFFLAIFGALGAKLGGASLFRGALRVTFWGGAAMAATALVGTLFNVAV